MSSNPVMVNSLDEKIWREFVDQHPQGNIFHTPEMFQVFARAEGYHPRLQAVVADDGQVLALLTPVEVTLMDGFLHRLTTRSIFYGSILSATDLPDSEALTLLLNTYVKDARPRALFTELRNLSDLSSIQPVLESCGFHYEDHLNYLIDLNFSPEQILQNIGSRTRKHIRQALRHGDVTIEQVNNSGQLASWYELVRKTYMSAHVPLADRSLFEAAFDILAPKGMISFWMAHIGSVRVAASAELHYKDVVYGWYSGLDRDYASEYPGELLIWHVLEWAAKNNYKIYDFGGAGKPNEEYGVRDFKAKFGGKQVCFGRYVNIHSPLLFRLSTLGYQILTSRLWSSFKHRS